MILTFKWCNILAYTFYFLYPPFKKIKFIYFIILSFSAEWRKNGGVLLMGYEMYRMLALRKMPKIPVKKSKKMKKLEMNLEPETNEQIKKYMEGNLQLNFLK